MALTTHRYWQVPVAPGTIELDLSTGAPDPALLPPEVKGGILYRSAVSSTLAASLELTRMGKIELRQTGAFAPIEVRTRREEDDA